MRYSVIPCRRWINDAGHIVSPYGAAPFVSERQRIAENWRIEQAGWTIDDSVTGEIGRFNGCPFDAESAAAAMVAKLNKEWSAAQESLARMVAATSRPVVWTRSISNDGLTVWHSGEGYHIAACGARFAPICPDGEALFPLATLAKAKAWCNSQIINDRRRAYHAAA